MNFGLSRDSAHRIHPMAGQGVNMGFADVECLVHVLEQAVRDGADFSKKSSFTNLTLEMLNIDSRFVDLSC